LSCGSGEFNGRLSARDEKLDLARKRVLTSVRKLRQIKLSLLQAEVIDRLIDGRRTATELVLEIFASRPRDEDFEAYYSRVRRDLRDLERRGYASTGLFGRDRPYRITPYGAAVLLSIVPDIGRVKLVRKREMLSFSATALAGVGRSTTPCCVFWPNYPVPQPELPLAHRFSHQIAEMEWPETIG
jgi:hypothetical protein